MGDLYDDEQQYWFAGYQDDNGNYYNLQDESGAVDYGDNITVDWDRWESFAESHDLHDAFIDADHVVIAWIDSDGDVNYATLPDGVDLDYWDFEEWLSQYE